MLPEKGLVVFNGSSPAADQNSVSASFQVLYEGAYLCIATGSGMDVDSGVRSGGERAH